MKTPGLSEKLFAKWYPVVMSWSEEAELRETRHQLIGQATGRTLELDARALTLPHGTDRRRQQEVPRAAKFAS